MSPSDGPSDGGQGAKPLAFVLKTVCQDVDLQWASLLGSHQHGSGHRRGWICLGDEHIEDVFGILSIGSRVVIQR